MIARRTSTRTFASLGAGVPALTFATLSAGALGLGCTALRGSGGVPRIESIQPDSVVMRDGVVVELLVRGSGFEPGTPGRNTVQFGEMPVPNVPASKDGKEIRFVVPDRMPLRGDAAPMPIESGEYRLRVQTAAGVSNPVVVRVYR